MRRLIDACRLGMLCVASFLIVTFVNRSASYSQTAESNAVVVTTPNEQDTAQKVSKARVTEKVVVPPTLRTESNIVFVEQSDYKVAADLYRPEGAERLPIVVMIHGGGWIAGDKWNVFDHARRMAEANMVVMAINYRLSPQYKWPAHLDDCFAALDWVTEHAEEWSIDTDRVGIWGYSAGAQLSLLMAMSPRKEKPKIRAVVAGGAPCDLSFIPNRSKALSTIMGGTRAEFPELYRSASPQSYVSKDLPPTFFFHGDKDMLVPIDNSKKLYDSMRDLGVDCEYYTAENCGHIITFVDPISQSKAIDFLAKRLLPEKRVPGNSP